ncbi:hypothetical protein ABN298_23010, partial [Escherichia coli]|uniref:hypothetical protein n=1 Tax=Escherichia coli TaxID=562 RepID=UPI0032DA4310
KRAYCLKTQPATGETYPKSDLFNKASTGIKNPGRLKKHKKMDVYSTLVTYHEDCIHNAPAIKWLSLIDFLYL